MFGTHRAMRMSYYTKMRQNEAKAKHSRSPGCGRLMDGEASQEGGWGGVGWLGGEGSMFFCKHEAPPFAMQIDLFVAVMLQRDEFFLSSPPPKKGSLKRQVMAVWKFDCFATAPGSENAKTTSSYRCSKEHEKV